MTMMKTAINTIKGLQKKGKSIFKAEEMELIKQFEVLGEDHMEQKDITKLEKIFNKGLTEYVKTLPNAAAYTEFVRGMYLDRFTRPMEQSFDYKVLLDENYEYYKFKYTPATDEESQLIKMFVSIYTLFHPLAAKFKHVKLNQWMRNGVIPKSLQVKKDPKKIIKGKVADVLVETIISLASEMAASYKKDLQEKIERGVKIVGITHVGDNYFGDARVMQNLNEISESIKTSFTFKLADKLGGFKVSSVTGKKLTIRDVNTFIISIDMDGKKLFIDGKRITNTSPKGTLFYQYPMTMRLENTVGENNIKQMLGGVSPQLNLRDHG